MALVVAIQNKPCNSYLQYPLTRNLKHRSTPIVQSKQVHSLNPEQDMDLEELRYAATEIIDIDQL